MKKLGFVFVILSGIGFGFLGIFGRLAFQSGMSVGELLTFRFALASILLFFGLLIFNPRLLKLDPKQILISSLLGIFGYAVFSTLYFKSIEGISVPLAALLLFTFPIFVNLGSHFILKEKMTKRQVLSLALATFGMVILLWGPMEVRSVKNIFFGLGAAIAYSIYVLVSGKVQKNVQPLSSSLYVTVSCAIALFLFHRPSLENLKNFSTHQYLIISGIAIVCTIAPLTLFLAGLQRISSSQASIVVMIEPVVATLAAFLFLSESLSFIQYIGAALVLLALSFS